MEKHSIIIIMKYHHVLQQIYHKFYQCNKCVKVIQIENHFLYQKIKNQKTPKSKTFKIHITDKELLQLTGGIVQGMSGTPIVQGDKIIGAISHAVENDPTTGYAVFIKWMIEK